jgi:hypothetical protein
MRHILFAILALTVLACQPSTTEIQKSDSGIVNGRVTQDYPEVIQLRRGGYPSCTATSVSDSTIITAAHCMGYGPSDLSYVDNKGVTHYAVAQLDSEKVDAAVVVFQKGTFKASASILQRAPKAGDVLVMVGYGQTDYINNNMPDGLKRVGRNTITSFADRANGVINHRYDGGDYLHYRSSIVVDTPVGEESMTGRGDSGGPMFINGQLAGCTSFGATRETLANMYQFVNEPNPDNSLIYEYDTNLLSPSGKELLLRAKSEIGAEIRGL